MAPQVVVLKRRTPLPLKPAAPISRPMDRNEIAAEVSRIKQLARTLRGPQNNKPDAFHEDKSELVHACERLEDAVRKGTPLSVT